MTAPSQKRAGPFVLGCLVLLILTIAVPYYFSSGSKISHSVAVISFLLDLALVTAILVAIGFSVTGKLHGLLITASNHCSLSRLQMELWTIVVIAMLFTAAKLNIVIYLAAKSDPLKITIPSELLAMMGIAAFTTVAGPSILALKASQSATSNDEVEAAKKRLVKATGGSDIGSVKAKGKILARDNQDDASWLDVILGDEVDNAGTVDLTKVQQLLITVLLVGMYVFSFMGLLVGDKAIDALPTLSADFITLLAISHAGYLAYKAAPKAGAPARAQGDNQQANNAKRRSK